jgi:hypothetical protein
VTIISRPGGGEDGTLAHVEDAPCMNRSTAWLDYMDHDASVIALFVSGAA